ncbi:preprotein translocase subunit SecY [Peloplasma aerotolerans]|uniref:Protein translocase subunit SecY n=1 Tax=Peloplasma aerotolerans TaxID=3044389 RepID=A0AAW6U9T2_9MOLU|nr:preprotein translocase subunit SecY [Mariniplasma sp. M4Ah]MDI6453434.1 preprotein translocase subunit SecY [Mariniplasma sp. M4Ah]
MWIRIKRILSNKTVMMRLAFTLFILLIVRLASHITVPLFDTRAIVQFMESSGSFVAILNNFSGQALERFSIMSLGISPYITASIAIQLLQMVVPSFKEMSEQGESGKAKLNQITRYLAIALAFIQGLALIIGISINGSVLIPSLEAADVERYRYFYYIYMAIVMMGGTALAIWLADLITKKGVGNGTSMLIVAGIVTSLPTMWTTLWTKYISQGTGGWDIVIFVFIMLLYFGILLGVVYMQIATRKIPVQYANRQGKSDSNIPMKINSAGVIPVIFAQTILSIPLSIVGFTASSTTGFTGWLNTIFNYQQPIGFILYVLLIVVFSFFYSFLTINPEKISDNLSKSNAYIPGVRPGQETQDFVAKLLFKITVIGTVYLVVLAVLPVLTSIIFGFQGQEAQAITLGGTSLLIIVGVAIETTQQVETDASQAEYSGIFK